MSPLNYVLNALASDGSTIVQREVPTYANKVEIGEIDLAGVRLSPDMSPSLSRKLLSMAVYAGEKSGEPCKQVADNAQVILDALALVSPDDTISVYHPKYNESEHTTSPEPVLTFTMTVKDLLAKLSGQDYVRAEAHNHAIRPDKPVSAKEKKTRQVLTLADVLAQRK